jgi:hypothetical protein
MFAVLKTSKFDIIFSIVVGFAIMSLTIPLCKGDDCFIKKAPSSDEMKKNTFKLGRKCYQFKHEIMTCPASGTIEAFTKFGMSGMSDKTKK